jgi:2-hydroxychromene-2-carboxylate isomerase
MMSKHIDYYFTPASPWTYFGHQRFLAMAKQHGASIAYKPVDYGKVFPVSGGLPLAKRPPQRQAYRLVELERWRKFLGVPLNLQPKFFPTPTDLASKLILASGAAKADTGSLAGAVMRACWAEDRNIADADTLAAICGECGLDGKALLAAAQGPEMGDRFEQLTQEAIERQVFGAPTYIFKNEPYWGQDRLDFLERSLSN